MPKKTTKKKVKATLPEDKKGTKCSFCGQIFTMPTGYSYPYQSEFSFENVDHLSDEGCIKYLRKELEDTKAELVDLKSRIKELERETYDEYH